MHSGGTPKFVEENNFEIIIPIERVPELQVGGNGAQEQIIELVTDNPEVTRKVMADKLNISVRTLQRALNSMPYVNYVGTGKQELIGTGKLMKRCEKKGDL